MRCPYCGELETRVVDSRPVGDGIRRRRKCSSCGARFTTYERVQQGNIFVVKKDGRREEYNRNKLYAGVRKACEKRPLPTGAVDKLVDGIEADIYKTGKVEIPSTVIGDLVIEGLKKLDHIAYIRFASIYREFTDITELKKEIDNLTEKEVPTNQLPLLPAGAVNSLMRKRRRSVS
jgi:transcriptional repressor NrdR